MLSFWDSMMGLQEMEVHDNLPRSLRDACNEHGISPLDCQELLNQMINPTEVARILIEELQQRHE